MACFPKLKHKSREWRLSKYENLDKISSKLNKENVTLWSKDTYFKDIKLLRAFYGSAGPVPDVQQFVLLYCQPEFMNQQTLSNLTSNEANKVSKFMNQRTSWINSKLYEKKFTINLFFIFLYEFFFWRTVTVL